MTASVLKQDPNTKRFKRSLIYFNTDTQYAHFLGKSPLSSHITTLKQQIKQKKTPDGSCFRTIVVILVLHFCGAKKQDFNLFMPEGQAEETKRGFSELFV